ncbi:MAG TPA: histidine kinase, partial [Galbitalea sp.]|nr:histidine kinase [Galbitalea sp.]
MELIAKERDRLLQRTARLLGLSGTIITLISLSFPGVVPLGNLVATLPFLVLLALCQVMISRNLPLLWA